MNAKFFAAIGAAVLCGAVAKADVQSQNIVGFQYVPVSTNYSVMSVTFNNIGGGQIDLNKISATKKDGTAFAGSECRGKLTAQRMSSGGSWNGNFKYYTAALGSQVNFTTEGWYNMATKDRIKDEDVVLVDGEALFFQNTLGYWAALKVDGEVDLNPLNPLPANGYLYSGNRTPVKIDFNKIKVLKNDGVTEYSGSECRGKVTAQLMSAGGKWIGNFKYYTAALGSQVTFTDPGWYDMSTKLKLANDKIMLEPGEGMFFQSTLTDASYLKLPSPIK